MKFTDLGLNDAILRAISDQGYTQPTPIQEQAIPAVLLGKDIWQPHKRERAKLLVLLYLC